MYWFWRKNTYLCLTYRTTPSSRLRLDSLSMREFSEFQCLCCWAESFRPLPLSFKHNEKYSRSNKIKNCHFIESPSSTLQILIYRHKRKFDESHFEERQPGSKSDKVHCNAFMGECMLDEERQKREKMGKKKNYLSALVRLKTPTHAKTCHTHIRVMDESCGLHNF